MLAVALRCVLEALRTPPGSKLFVFAIEALRCFPEQLAQWPTYCSHLLQARPRQPASCLRLPPLASMRTWMQACADPACVMAWGVTWVPSEVAMRSQITQSALPILSDGQCMAEMP